MDKTKKGIIIIVITAIVMLIIGLVGGYVFSQATQNNSTVNETQTGEAYSVSIDEAKNIALKDAGVSADSVTFTKAKEDREDGFDVYELDFRTADKKYEYEVRVSNGEIYSKSIENISNVTAPSPSDATKPDESVSSGERYIGVDRAKEIALERAGVDPADAEFMKAKLKRDDGIMIYDVEFDANGYDYELEIDALDGTILDYDSDFFDYDD